MLLVSRKFLKHPPKQIANLKQFLPPAIHQVCIDKYRPEEVLRQSEKCHQLRGDISLSSSLLPVNNNNHITMGSRHRGGNHAGNGGGGFHNNGYGKIYNNVAQTRSNNDIMQIMSAMVANNLNMNPPPPPPVRIFCGDLRPLHVGLYVEMTGRLIRKRAGRFMELRDRGHGACQLVILEERYPRVARRLANMPENTVVHLAGIVQRRPKTSCNLSMPTGEIEVEVQDILNIDIFNNKKPGDKRSYSTMSEVHSTAITSTEYKISKSESVLKYFENRDLTCNDIRRKDIGKEVTLVGWLINTKSTKFLHLKDGYGQTQIMIEEDELRNTVANTPEGTVVQVTGKVFARPKQNINKKQDTGEVEMIVSTIKMLNPIEPYNGPIKIKDKVQKLRIDDVLENEATENEQAAGETKKGAKQVSPSSKSTESNIVKTADLNKFTGRTHNCGELTVNDIGSKVTICGWLEYQRLNKFFVLRDSYGTTQVILTKLLESKKFDLTQITSESVLQVEGVVAPRPTATINKKMKTGHIEIEATQVKVLNRAKKNLPFDLRQHNKAGERIRLAHRYIDMRGSEMQNNLRMRSQIIMRMREYLINYLGFVEVETPTLFRRTPGGAQEFVVPTRKPGHFYSLVQSPQQFKQMLMAGGIDRYFQVARCYRDEATRPDRQPEFTQLDIELSFTTRDDIMQLIEELLRFCWPKEAGKIKAPFQRMTYADAMYKYGTDKPDLRFGMTLTDVKDIIQKDPRFIKIHPNLGAYAIVVKDKDVGWSVNARHHYETIAKSFPGTCFVRRFTAENDVTERLTKIMNADVAAELIAKFELVENDVLFLGIGDNVLAQKLLGTIRNDYQGYLIRHEKVCQRNENRILWIVDFPMFEKNTLTGAIESVHHPFTAPHPDDADIYHESKSDNWLKVRSQAYDLVINGQEVGGGSIRIHDRKQQQFVLDDILNIPHDHLSHLLNALESGCPPHGGIALGLDRLMSIMCKANSIRDVIAFPKSLNGKDPISKAPVIISPEEIKMYHLSVPAVSSNEDETTMYTSDIESEIFSPLYSAEGSPTKPDSDSVEQPMVTDGPSKGVTEESSSESKELETHKKA